MDPSADPTTAELLAAITDLRARLEAVEADNRMLRRTLDARQPSPANRSGGSAAPSGDDPAAAPTRALSRRGLLAGGVARVSLLEEDRVVYGPMSLEP